MLKRAEDEEQDTLVDTFVDASALYSRLSNRDSQVFFGRRGTGKTHALSYLAGKMRRESKTVVYIDLRTVGSNGGTYGDPGVSIAEAGTRLLIDVLSVVHGEIVDQALEAADEDGDYAASLPLLDQLFDALSEVEVVGDVEWRESAAQLERDGSEASVGGNASPLAPAPIFRLAATQGRESSSEREEITRGVSRHRVHFGAVQSTLTKLVKTLPKSQLWLLLDEWSHVPVDLQPLLADLIRRCVLPVKGLTVKIAAIEKRSEFRVDDDAGGYLGIELGADVAGDIDLDEFMVFSNDQELASDFMGTLLHKHVQSMREENPAIPLYATPEEMIAEAFASEEAFGELVRAAEGVPRDLINIVGKAALKANARRIRVGDIRDSARSWYNTDKEGAVKKRPDARALLHWIIDRVIGDRKVRGFLLEQSVEHHLVDFLYDQRLLHVIKRGISAKDQPGVRFDAYALDFGCYVDLLSSKSSPRGLLVADHGGVVDVPPDDYDQVRNAILDIQSFSGDPALAAGNRSADGDSLAVSAPHGRLRWFGGPDEPVTDPRAFAFEGSGWYVIVEIDGRYASVPIDRNVTRIGSSSNDHIRLKHRTVTPRHAVIERRDGEHAVRVDRGMHLYVNNRKTSGASVTSGDILKIGAVNVSMVYLEIDRSATTDHGTNEDASIPHAP